MTYRVEVQLQPMEEPPRWEVSSWEFTSERAARRWVWRARMEDRFLRLFLRHSMKGLRIAYRIVPPRGIA